MNIKIRRLKKRDFQRGFFESLANLYPANLTPEEAEKIYRQVCSNPVYHFFVAESEGEIVGTATLLIEQKFLLRGSKFGHIEDVATRKEFEKRGVGRLLIAAAVTKAKQEGCLQVRLNCHKNNVPFYEKCGFQKKQLMMQLNLHFVVVA